MACLGLVVVVIAIQLQWVVLVLIFLATAGYLWAVEGMCGSFVRGRVSRMLVCATCAQFIVPGALAIMWWGS